MAEHNIQPQEHSTARENHLVVVLDLRTGKARVLADPTAMREAAADVRHAQQQAGVRMLVGHGP